MNAHPQCTSGDAEERAARYVHGTLAGEELARFESHMLECPTCQARVREAVLLGSALSDTPVRRARGPLVTGAVLAAAALAAVFLLPSGDPVERLGRIGDVVPGFDGLPVRAGTEDATAVADRGMAAYLNGDFARAAELLAEAAVADPTPGLHFFLGIARLKLGDAPGAETAFESALVPQQNAYADEARLYLAKARLTRRDVTGALAALGAVADPTGSVWSHARALEDSIRAAGR